MNPKHPRRVNAFAMEKKLMVQMDMDMDVPTKRVKRETAHLASPISVRCQAVPGFKMM